MKKYLMVAFFAIACMSIQKVFAATLSLSNVTNTTSTNLGVTQASGVTVSAALQGVSVWAVELSGLGSSGLADLDFSITVKGVPKLFLPYFNVPDITSLTAGTYFLTVIALPGAITYDFTISATEISGSGVVPVPAALWLFGSALAAVFGVSHRKRRIALAA